MGDVYRSFVEGYDLDAILCNNLGNELWLLDDESGAQLDNTFLHGSDSILKTHVLLESIV